MPVAALQVAKRTLVSLLLSLARAYQILIQINRDSSDEDVKKAFRKVSVKVHPDKGGATADFQRLNEARAAWLEAAGRSEDRSKGKGRGGRQQRASSSTGANLATAMSQWQDDKKRYRIQGEAILLTYQSWPPSLVDKIWKAFLAMVRASLDKWSVRRWAATAETNEDGRVHLHLMLQFRQAIDRVATGFIFQGTRPNVSTNDLCGDGVCKKKLQQSIDRGMFYTWVQKIGTLHVAANYEPCWTNCKDKYQVLGAWPEKLWKQRKLTTAKYEEYLFLTRDGVPFRKRNLDAVREHERELEEEAAIEATTQRIRSNPSLY